jgi:hypothetical protein
VSSQADRGSADVIREKPEPVPSRPVSDAILWKASAAEIAECLTFTGHHDPMIAGIAVERLLEHCQAGGMVLMAQDAAPESENPLEVIMD